MPVSASGVRLVRRRCRTASPSPGRRHWARRRARVWQTTQLPAAASCAAALERGRPYRSTVPGRHRRDRRAPAEQRRRASPATPASSARPRPKTPAGRGPRAFRRGRARAPERQTGLRRGSLRSGSGFSAARTTSGVNGGCRKRTPVASKIALAIAAVPGTDDDSPAPERRLAGPRHRQHLDHRHLAEAQDRVAAPLAVGDHARRRIDAAPAPSARGWWSAHVAVNLVLHAGRVDHQPGVVADDDARAHAPRR